MARLAVLTSFCIGVACGTMRINHYMLKQSPALRQMQSPIICFTSGVIMCAIKCSSTTNCESFSVDRKTNCNSYASSNVLQTPSTTIAHTGNNLSVKCSETIGMYEASENGQLCYIQKILSQGLENINCRGKENRTLVMTAAIKGQLAVFDFLVSQGCDLSAVDDYNDTVLHMACIGGNVDIVKKLLDNEKYDVNSRGCHLRTPVMYAVSKNHINVVHFLKKKGCDMRLLDDENDSILHVACIEASVDMVRYILNLNIDGLGMECKGAHGWTSVLSAAMIGNIRVVEFLVSKGCNLKTCDDDGDNILHVACMHGNVDMVKYILQQNISGIDIECRGASGWTPVFIGARYGNIGVVEFLVSKGCNLKTRDDDGDNILHVVCIKGNVDMVKYILQQNIPGVDIESKGYSGKTAEMIARRYDQRELVNFLASKRIKRSKNGHRG